MKRSIVRFNQNSKGKKRLEAVSEHQSIPEINTRLEMIQALIPLGLRAVEEELQQEVTALAGLRYQRGTKQCARWGSQPGSVYLGEHKVSLCVPRVRDPHRGKEVPLSTYQQLRQPRRADDMALRKILKGLSCGDYESCVELVPETFGLSPSSVSRRFKRVTSRQLQQLCERDLTEYDLVAVFLDGKTFAEDAMVIALGVTLGGQKVVLGFVQTATENEKVCSAFLRRLQERGLKAEEGLLFVIDGAKGLRAAIRRVFGRHGVVQRCQWHKRENVVSYLPKSKQPTFRRKLQSAYQQPTYAQAKASLKKVRSELALLNKSAAASLDEGLEETLTLHRLGMFKELGESFKTTNCLENINALVGQRTDKVDRWINSDQKQRWMAAALLDIEPRLRKVRGYCHLPKMKTALKSSINSRLEKVA